MMPGGGEEECSAHEKQCSAQFTVQCAVHSAVCSMQCALHSAVGEVRSRVQCSRCWNNLGQVTLIRQPSQDWSSEDPAYMVREASTNKCSSNMFFLSNHRF